MSDDLSIPPIPKARAKRPLHANHVPLPGGDMPTPASRTNGVNAHLPDAFVGATDAPLEVMSEKPWHRAAILMWAQGFTLETIASTFGKNPKYVSMLLRQPWAQERLIHETTLAGREDLEEILKIVGPKTIFEVV